MDEEQPAVVVHKMTGGPAGPLGYAVVCGKRRDPKMKVAAANKLVTCTDCIRAINKHAMAAKMRARAAGVG